MKYLYASILPAFLFLITKASATDSSCLKITLPNFLGIGECFGNSGDICTQNATGVAVIIADLLGCSIKGIGSLDLGSQLFLLEDLLTYLLTRNGLGYLGDLLYGLCGLLNGLVDCSGLKLNASTLCEDQITLSLPSALGLGTCLNQTGETCDAGTPVLEPAVVGFFRVLSCLVNNIFDSNLGGLLNGLVCSVLNIISTTLGGRNPLIQAVFKAIQKILRTKCT
ncbi:uncharacterized protein ISCGN_021165 [Ixodes scapularis]